MCSKHSMTDVSVSAAPLPVSSDCFGKDDVQRRLFFLCEKAKLFSLGNTKHLIILYFIIRTFQRSSIEISRVAKEISMSSFVCIIIF